MFCVLSVSHYQQRAARGHSAATEFGQEIGHAEEDPHHQEVWAEGQQGQRVQEAGVQPEVTHWQQAAQVLLDHPLPRPNAAESWEVGVGGGGGGVEQQKRLEQVKGDGEERKEVEKEEREKKKGQSRREKIKGRGEKRWEQKKYKGN